MKTATGNLKPQSLRVVSNATQSKPVKPLPTLPGDDIRQIMWRYADRYDYQMAIQSTRAVARGLAAKLVAQGQRNTHEWTPQKAELLKAFDEAGITAVFLDPSCGGFIEGPKNLILSLVAFELAWVDGGAATCSLATNLGLAPIYECGTPEQREFYMRHVSPPQPGEDRPQWRCAFSLTEPLPYVGVETTMLSGKVRIVEWKDGQEPLLQVEKRGRFITNMDFANVVTAAVESDDPRIKGSCLIVLHEDDPGVFDRGSVTKKLVHQLSSTRDPIFNLRVPASRIVGGYTLKDGVIIPNKSHGEVIENVFKRTRVPVGLMTSAKLLSAIEPVIRYQRNRFRGSETSTPGSPRYELGLQQKEDALHRLIDVWAIGEAGASFGFATERMLDAFEPLEKETESYLASLEEGASSGRAKMKLFAATEKEALEFVALYADPEKHTSARFLELKEKPLVQFLALDSVLNVLCPAVKLWNTSVGATYMRDAVSLVGGYGVTEDCPGFLGQKWMDAQLEATYEGPESVQRRHLAATMTNEIFLATFRTWIAEMRRIAGTHPGTGACTLATAMTMWLEALRYLREGRDANGAKLYNANRQGVTFPMADALCWLLAARQLILDVLRLEQEGASHPVLAADIDAYTGFYIDLCHVQAARSAGEAGRITAEILHGYRRHPAWDTADTQCCSGADNVASLESVMPGFAASTTDIVNTDGSHPSKAGPCVRLEGFERFAQLRAKLDGCLTGCRLAKDRAAEAITKVMIPETLDYPQ